MPPAGSKSGPEGEALVDAIQRTNEDLIALVCARRTDETAKLYVEFVKNWYEKDLDENLVCVAVVIAFLSRANYSYFLELIPPRIHTKSLLIIILAVTIISTSQSPTSTSKS